MFPEILYKLKTAAGRVTADDGSSGSIFSTVQAFISLLSPKTVSKVVASIAALKALDKTKYAQAFVTGYYAQGDGGGGAYYYDSSDTTSADNGGTIIVATDGARWKLTDTTQASVKQFGAKGDGATNDRVSIKATFSWLITAGGGTLLFPPGTYIVSGVDQQVNFSNIELTVAAGVVDVLSDVQIYVQQLHDAKIIFQGGAVLRSTKTDGGTTICFDGCYNLSFVDLKLIGETVMDTAAGTETVTGTTGLALISRLGASSNINFHNHKSYKHFAHVFINGVPTSSDRVAGVTFSGATRLDHGRYGFALHNNGDNVVVENAYTYQLNRPLFAYGVSNFNANIVADAINDGFKVLVKAYSRNTIGGKLRLLMKDRANVQPKVGFESEHNNALQPTPAYIEDVDVTYLESNVDSASTIAFSYYRSGVLTATSSSKLFNNIRINGKTAGSIDTNVVLSSASNPCIIDISDFETLSTYDSSKTKLAFLEQSGFYQTPRKTYTPTLKFGGGNTGMTGTFLGEYYVSKGMLFVTIDITLTAKGSSTGSTIISLPAGIRKDTPLNFVYGPFIVQNGTTIPACVMGYTVGTLTDLRLRTQGAASDAALTDANFNNNTRIFGTVVFPI
jgi:hypothetical protein